MTPAQARLRSALIKAGFEPGQPRDEDGQWTDTGGGSSKAPKRNKTLNEHVQNAVTFARPAVREILANTAAGLITTTAAGHLGSMGGIETDLLAEKLKNLSTELRVSSAQAKELLLTTYRRTAKMMGSSKNYGKDVEKDDDLLPVVMALIAALEKLGVE